MLDYFDAFLIGLTATPSAHTIAFFNRNLVMEYTHLDAVADGINVNGDIYRIRTRLGEQGGQVPEGDWVTKLGTRRPGDASASSLTRVFTYDGRQLGRDVINQDQIRLVMQTYRDKSLPRSLPRTQRRHRAQDPDLCQG